MVKFSTNLKQHKHQWDLIVFDIDGVLIDTSLSFPYAIAKAVVHFGKLAGFSDWREPSLEEVGWFKTVPGFNNDWDLCEGMAVFYLQNSVCHKPLPLPEFLQEITKNGAGLTGIKNWISTRPEACTKKITSCYQPQLIRRLGMEYYAGKKYFEFLYGLKPEFGIETGTITTEKILVDPSLLRQLPLTAGIYTGRNEKEFELVNQKIGFDYFRQDCIVVDDGTSQLKPDPAPLLQMARLCDSKGVIFVGDSFDDYRTVQNFQAASHAIACEFVQVIAESDSQRIKNRQPFDSQISWVGNANQIVTYFLREKFHA